MNGCEVLADCLRSLRESSFSNFVPIVVITGSTDESATSTRENFPEAMVIIERTPLGFTGSTNLGLTRGLEMGARAFLLLNNDTVVHPEALGNMLRELESEPRIGAVTPKILYHDPSDRIWSAGGEYTLWKGIPTHRGLRSGADDLRYTQPRDVSFGTGCALAIKRKVIEEIGLLDDDLFLYNEDGDYSLRMRKAGFRIRYTPDAIIWHRVGWTSKRWSGQFRHVHLGTRNLLRVHRKHRRWYHLLGFVPYFTWRRLGITVVFALVRRDFATAKAVFSGIRSYFRGETGPIKP